ncbi:hypothetical protein D3C81_2183520 [compost metagenome]
MVEISRSVKGTKYPKVAEILSENGMIEVSLSAMQIRLSTRTTVKNFVPRLFMLVLLFVYRLIKQNARKTSFVNGW